MRRATTCYAYLLSNGAKGKTFFDKTPGYSKLQHSFGHLIEGPCLGVHGSDAGVGKTVAIRNLYWQLPQPDYQITYRCDTNIAPVDPYRSLALELGVRTSHRRSQVWAELNTDLVEASVDSRPGAMKCTRWLVTWQPDAWVAPPPHASIA